MNQQDVQALATLCLVSKKYHRIAEPRLYERLPLIYRATEDGTSVGNIPVLLRKLRNSHLSQCVTHITIAGIPSNRSKAFEVDFRSAWAAYYFMSHVFSDLPKVKTLTIDFTPLLLNNDPVLRRFTMLMFKTNLKRKLPKLKVLELKSSYNCNMLIWIGVFAHATLEELKTSGVVFKDLKHAKGFPSKCPGKVSKMKRLDLGMVQLPADGDSTKSLEFIAGSCPRLEYLRVQVDPLSDLTSDTLAWVLSSFSDTFKGNVFRQLEVVSEEEYTFMITDDGDALKAYNKDHPNHCSISWSNTAQISTQMVDAAHSNAALANALQVAAFREAEVGLCDVFAREVQRTLALCASAVAGMGGYCHVVMFVDVESISTESLSFIEQATIAEGSVFHYRPSDDFTSSQLQII